VDGPEDFAELRNAGLTRPLMDEIEKQLAAGSSAEAALNFLHLASLPRCGLELSQSAA
jgi:hypothetical protein